MQGRLKKICLNILEHRPSFSTDAFRLALPRIAARLHNDKRCILYGIFVLTALTPSCGKDDSSSSASTVSSNPSGDSVTALDLADKAITADKIAPIKPTGASEARDLQDILSDVVSVKDFGAVGDGITDDTSAIQAAFDYAGANAVKLLAPSGSYLIDTTINWEITGGFHLECEPGTVFLADSKFPVDAKFFKPFALSGDQKFIWKGGTIDGRNMPPRLNRAPNLLSISSKSIAKVLVDGVYFLCNDNRAGNANDSGFAIAETEDFVIQNCHFQGAIDSAIYISGDDNGTGIYLGKRGIVRNNFFSECFNAIISKRQFEDHIVEGNMIWDSRVGIVLGGEADVTKLPGKFGVVANNFLKNVGRGIEIKNSDGTVVTGNRIQNYGIDDRGRPYKEFGIRLRGSSHCVVTGNSILIDSSISPSPGLAALSLEAYVQNGITYYSNNNLVIGNKIKNTSTVFSEVGAVEKNVFVYNFPTDYTVLERINSSNSKLITYDSNMALINFYGKSGAKPAPNAQVFYEANKTLNFQYCVPSNSSFNIIVGDENNNSVSRISYNHPADEWQFQAGGSDVAFAVNQGGPILPKYTVDSLPNSGAGAMAFATNGRKKEESAGNGTGVLCYHDGNAWIASDSDSPVSD